MESIRMGRMKIAKLLSLMGFHDDDPDATTQIMRQRLREIEERTTAANCSTTTRKLKIKFGGKASVIQEDPTNHDTEPGSSSLPSENRDNEDGVMELNNGDNMGTHSTSVALENPNSDHMEIEDFIRSIGGSEVKLVIEKMLTKSDCEKSQGRLLIPTLQVKNHGFLWMDEEDKLGNKESISVEVFDPERRKLTLNLVQWKMTKKTYALKTNWKKLVITNGLKESMVIRVLSFRLDQKLCFAVVRV
ncbi:putative transcription factor B3-Domain family [Helianthus debilis subsp. tardiflorus]